jgi:anti-anti-sigma factor
MDMKLEWQDGILVAWLDGDLDAANSEVIEAEFKQMVEKRPKGVLLNFAKARYVSSLGIGLIMSLNRDLKGIGAKLRITGVQAAIRLVLDTCNLGSVIPMDQTMEHAMKMLHGKPVAAGV